MKPIITALAALALTAPAFGQTKDQVEELFEIKAQEIPLRCIVQAAEGAMEGASEEDTESFVASCALTCSILIEPYSQQCYQHVTKAIADIFPALSEAYFETHVE